MGVPTSTALAADCSGAFVSAVGIPLVGCETITFEATATGEIAFEPTGIGTVTFEPTGIGTLSVEGC